MASLRNDDSSDIEPSSAVRLTHGIGTPSSFGRKSRRKKDNTIDLCLFGRRRCFVLGKNGSKSSNLYGSRKSVDVEDNKIDATASEKKQERSYSSPFLFLDEKPRWTESQGITTSIPLSSRPSQAEHHIDLQNLRRLASQGIPDPGSHRPVAWRVLLGYLPCELRRWQEVLDRDRKLYKELVCELFETAPLLRNDVVENVDSKRKKTEQFGLNDKVDSNLSNEDIKDISELSCDGPGLKEMKNSEIVSNIRGSEAALDDNDSPKNSAFNNDSLSKNIEVFNVPSHNPDDSKIDHLRHLSAMRNYSSPIQSPSNEDTAQSFRSVSTTLSTEESIKSTFIEQEKSTNEIQFRSRMESFEDSDDSLNSQDGLSGSNVADINANKNEHVRPTQFTENFALLDEIRKDVVRTHPGFSFFLEPENNLGQKRYAALERILFVWAKLNKGVRYVQGMNEIVGTIFFVLATDLNEEWAEEAEADAYFLFNILMVEMRDVFVPAMDLAETGIQGRISDFINLLSLHDPEVRCHLDTVGIDASFFGVRWLTTLLSREFMLPDTIRIWDSMFASTHMDNFLRYVCVTMVMVIRKKLLESDFSQCLRLLQSYPPTNIDRLLESSRALWIYESQVTLACYKGSIDLYQALTTIAPPSAIIMAYGLVGGLAGPSVIAKSSMSSDAERNKFLLSAMGGPKGMDTRGKSLSPKKGFLASTAKNFISQMTNLMSETSSTSPRNQKECI